MKDEYEQTANFFYPPDQLGNKQKFVHSRRILKPKNTVSNPSTQLTISKRSSDHSGLHTPPQISELSKRSEILRDCEMKKTNNYRILSSNINQRQSYPQQISFRNEFLFVNEQKINQFAQSPVSKINKLPEIFNHRSSCQGFKQNYRIQSSQSKRDTISNFTHECPKQQCIQEFINKSKQNSLVNLFPFYKQNNK
ncbi:unnamed protein product (macronuclear) [Paramecium tetraurelia]|uniref:Uncharacterized protein n=1 Tax=Paramecium tetraurelia TaxID=5888 RepID=A0CGE8_PARTE|nr:uncharacterized protein GSPATT00007305001 [Paramecium tetraurelia]CAK69865.1 unnamed protein product [Paramecium tetraurelia]|eukprot:XP_001437262.1 hypothetical protein (macronuclear) [Paramecium tetraurelia strain d4-2]